MQTTEGKGRSAGPKFVLVAHRSMKGALFFLRICRFSYLKYLEAIDVEHAHDLVASFSLCLQGDEMVKSDAVL